MGFLDEQIKSAPSEDISVDFDPKDCMKTSLLEIALLHDAHIKQEANDFKSRYKNSVIRNISFCDFKQGLVYETFEIHLSMKIFPS